MQTSPDSFFAEVPADPACSYWLRDRIREALERDPLDALRDAETLVAILQERWHESVRHGLAAVPVGHQSGCPEVDRNSRG